MSNVIPIRRPGSSPQEIELQLAAINAVRTLLNGEKNPLMEAAVAALPDEALSSEGKTNACGLLVYAYLAARLRYVADHMTSEQAAAIEKVFKEPDDEFEFKRIAVPEGAEADLV
jgi:hypothetical protein